MMVISIGFWVQAIWALALYQSLTPVFEDLECTLVTPTVTSVSANILTNFWIDISTGTDCYNPNPYKMTMESAGPMAVYMGVSRDEVGTLEEIEKSTLPAEGRGGIDANMRIEPSSAVWASLFSSSSLSIMLGGSIAIPIYIDMEIAIDVDVNLFFGRMVIAKAFDRQCGFNMAVTLTGVKIGAMACADGWDNLVLPAVSASASADGFDATLDLQAENLASDEIEEGTKTKNAGLGAAIASGFILGTFFLSFSSFCTFMGVRAMRARSAPLADAKQTNEARDPPEKMSQKEESKEVEEADVEV
eukprot:CAMPEP_0206489706 /NCGR_PEP_ID=MMETSP0324_2-20121206/43477_1 /ASSEMBLY_ACC=CAM_ASM_000836 /TAXON_ID=2866 /ORGANISM="Crypthecodinium cohnii, Strain Seligo" /LENGTH=302 /DNA_ID=CAMNT_0053969591 /DNA_START=178 /DNA_END=1086 /DNA_ORIENTATION=+